MFKQQLFFVGVCGVVVVVEVVVVEEEGGKRRRWRWFAALSSQALH
jgi:hypothetical protein